MPESMTVPEITVLIVDDRPENLLALRSMLESPDYRVAEAASGEEALRMVLQEDCALILMDVLMPGMNGFETIRLMKTVEKLKSVPVILMTSLGQATEHLLEGYEAGAIDFVFKPLQPAIIRLKVEQFVRMHIDRRQLQEQQQEIGLRTAELERLSSKLLETSRGLQSADLMARMLGETAVDSFLTADSRGRILAANPAVHPMFGYTPEEIEGQPVWLLLPDTRMLFEHALRLTALAGTTLEHTALDRTGSYFAAELQIGSGFYGGQEVFVLAVRDVTERKRQYLLLERAVEERTRDLQIINDRLQQEMEVRMQVTRELQASHDRMHDVLESITDAFYALDWEWKITYMNGSAEKQIRMNRDMALGRCLWDILPRNASSSGGYELMCRAIEQQQPMQEEFYSTIMQGWIDIRVYPSPHGVSVYARDTTEHRRMKQDARDSQERFYTIFQASPSLMAIRPLNEDRYLDVNESWIRHTGYTYEEMITGQSDLLQMSVERSEAAGTTCDLGGADETVAGLKVQYRSKSGEERVGLLSTQIIHTPQEPCVLTVITDITERTRLEQEMGRLDRLHLIGEMAAGIAHEIRNPMTTVRGFLQLMRSKKTAPPRDIIDVMIEELNRANGIISEFLALAKNKNTDRQLKNLADIIMAIHPLLQAEATLAGKVLELQLADIRLLELDEKEIRQMILNLALNGLEAMESGGTLRISTQMDGDEVVLAVSDQGHGMTPEVLDKLGTPFFTTKEQGTGLGLAVCFSIAARHQAQISWKTGSRGTVFYVRFRVTQPETAADAVNEADAADAAVS